MFFFLNTKTELDISGNCFKSEVKKILELKSLKKLNLSFNNLEKIWPLPVKIHTLILNNNKIQLLQNNLMLLKNLKYLNLDNNCIVDITCLANLKELQILF